MLILLLDLDFIRFDLEQSCQSLRVGTKIVARLRKIELTRMAIRMTI